MTNQINEYKKPLTELEMVQLMSQISENLKNNGDSVRALRKEVEDEIAAKRKLDEN